MEFQSANTYKLEILIDEMRIPVLSLEDLIKNKESTGREKDALDARMLKKRLISNDSNTTKNRVL